MGCGVGHLHVIVQKEGTVGIQGFTKVETLDNSIDEMIGLLAKWSKKE